MKDITLIGKAGAGKDTVAQLVNMYSPVSYDKLAFADAMKDFYHSIFVDVPNMPKPRAGYQWFGQTLRSYDADVWIKQLEPKFKRITEVLNKPVIITDLRQPNEYTWCKEHGFIIVKVWANVETRLKRLNERGDNFKLEDLLHETEGYIDEFEYDFFIDNNGTIDDLKPQIKRLTGHLNR